MSRTCELCGKKPSTGNNVSHAHNKTKRIFRPNIQNVNALQSNGAVKAMKVCTRCIRSGAIKKSA